MKKGFHCDLKCGDLLATRTKNQKTNQFEQQNKMVVDQIDLTGLSKSCVDFAKVINSDQFRSVRSNYEEKFNKYDHRAHLKKDEHLKSLIEQAKEKMRSKEFKICSKLYNEVGEPELASNSNSITSLSLPAGTSSSYTSVARSNARRSLHIPSGAARTSAGVL